MSWQTGDRSGGWGDRWSGAGAVVAVEVLGEEVEASMRTSRPPRKFRLVTKISQNTTHVTQDMQHNDEFTRR